LNSNEIPFIQAAAITISMSDSKFSKAHFNARGMDLMISIMYFFSASDFMETKTNGHNTFWIEHNNNS